MNHVDQQWDITYGKETGHRAVARLPPHYTPLRLNSFLSLQSAHAFPAEQHLLPLSVLLNPPELPLTFLLSLVGLGHSNGKGTPESSSTAAAALQKAATAAKDLDCSWNPKAWGAVPRAEQKEQSSFVRIKTWTGNGSKWGREGRERQGEWKSVYNAENLRRLRGAAKGGAGGTADKRFLVRVNNIHVC